MLLGSGRLEHKIKNKRKKIYREKSALESTTDKDNNKKTSPQNKTKKQHFPPSKKKKLDETIKKQPHKKIR